MAPDAEQPAATRLLTARFREWHRRRQQRATERDIARREDRKLRSKFAERDRLRGAGCAGDAAGGGYSGGGGGGGGCE